MGVQDDNAQDNSSSENDVVRQWTDNYFLKTRTIVERFGDIQVTYAVFMRRPVIFAPKLSVDWLQKVARERDVEFQIKLKPSGP